MSGTSYLSAILFTLSLVQTGFQLPSNSTLHLLVLVPLGNEKSNTSTCLDIGEELIPAAEIAAESVNNNTDILSGYTLDIIAAKTDLCTAPTVSDSLASFVNFTTNSSFTIVGLIGLVCPSALLSLSPIASLPYFELLQISSSTSPPSIVTGSRNNSIDLLYHTAPSNRLLNMAVLALMKHNAWSAISVVRHTDSINLEHDVLANSLQEMIEREEGLNISVYAETPSGIDRILNEIRLSGIRIVFASVTDPEARQLLCGAFVRGMSWPNYLWILHGHTLENLLHAEPDCPSMSEALEGILLLYHNIDDNKDRTISFFNSTYKEYFSKYNRSLHEGDHPATPTCNREPQILNANALHDSVLAFALALNKSLPHVDHLSCFGVGRNSCSGRDLSAHLDSVRFSGAGGEVSFSNLTHELTAAFGVNVYQIFDGKSRFIGNVTGQDTSGLNDIDISYTYKRVLVQVPLSLPIITLVLVAVLFVLTIAILVLFVHYRDAPYIKAASPVLSYIILLACFFLDVSIALAAVRYGLVTGRAYAACCISEQWFTIIGIQLIFGTLFFRLVRVARIFFDIRNVDKYWSDKWLTFYVFGTILLPMLLLLLWTLLTDLGISESETFVHNGDPPYFSIEIKCIAEENGLFPGLIYAYVIIFMLLVMIFAIKTRKVTIESFKDTRSVNSFVFCSVITLALFLPLSFIFGTSTGVQDLTLSYLFKVGSISVVVCACLCLLFVPKIYAARYKREVRRKSIGSSYQARNNSFTSSVKVQHEK